MHNCDSTIDIFDGDSPQDSPSIGSFCFGNIPSIHKMGSSVLFDFSAVSISDILDVEFLVEALPEDSTGQGTAIHLMT